MIEDIIYYGEHRSKTFLSVEMLSVKAKNVKKATLMLLIFAFYGRLLEIGKVILIVYDKESLPRPKSFNYFSLSLLELPQSRFKVESAPTKGLSAGIMSFLTEKRSQLRQVIFSRAVEFGRALINYSKSLSCHPIENQF